MHKTTTKERQEIVERYLDGESSPSIASDYNISSVAVRGLLKRRGVKMRSNSEAQRKCSLRRNAFATITEESAYWIGFIMADGTVVERDDGSPETAVVLAEKDRPHLVKLRRFLGSTHKIVDVDGKHPACRFAVRSQGIADDLHKYGVTPNKTKTARVKQLAENRHFWRGVVDGDGSFGMGQNRGNTTPYFNVLGSEPLMMQFSGFLYKEINHSLSVCAHKSIFKVSTMSGPAVKIIDLLYHNCSIALERKLNAAKNIRSRGIRSRQMSSA